MSRERQRPGRRSLAGRWAALLALVAVAVFLAALWQPFGGRGQGAVSVTISRGAGLGQIADTLDRLGVVSSGFLFELRVRLAGKSSDIVSGSYELRRGMSYASALDALTPGSGSSAAQRTLSVIIPEGLSRREVAPLVARAGVRGDYRRASRSSALLDPRDYGGDRARNLDGFLFPATYQLRPGASARALVEKQLRAFDRELRGVSMRYARKKNLTPYDVLTIASMVEREVQVPRERRLVAAVIYNRLKRGEPLGIDATVRYAVGNWSRPLTSSQLETSSAYNTRRRAGLPPGPIGSPGRAAIAAAANPARLGYLYYVVKPATCGEHEFARTQAGFERARQRYNEARRAAGGRSPTNCG